MADDVNSWDAAKPAATDYIDASDELLRANYAANEEMMGLPMEKLVVKSAGATDKAMTITFDRLTMVKKGTPPQITFTDNDLSATTFTVDIDNGAGNANGYETGMALTAGWKYIWMLRDDTNGTTCAFLSTDTALTDITMPTNYQFGKLVGAGYYDGTNTFRAFMQHGNRVTYKAAQQILSDVADTSWTQLTDVAAFDTFVPGTVGGASIATRMWGYAKLWYTVTGSNQIVSMEWGADSSGNHPGTVLSSIIVVSGGGHYTRAHFEQELDEAALELYYKLTCESAGTPAADAYIQGYEMAI